MIEYKMKANSDFIVLVEGSLFAHNCGLFSRLISTAKICMWFIEWTSYPLPPPPHHPPLSLSAPFPRIHYSFYPTLTLKWICCLIIMNYRNAFGYCDWKCICTDYAHWFIRIPLKARIIIMQKCWIIHRNELHSLPLSLSDPFHWIYYSSYFTFRL